MTGQFVPGWDTLLKFLLASRNKNIVVLNWLTNCDRLLDNKEQLPFLLVADPDSNYSTQQIVFMVVCTSLSMITRRSDELCYFAIEDSLEESLKYGHLRSIGFQILSVF